MGAVPLLVLAMASTSAAGALRIESDVDCPRAAELGASVRRVLGAEPTAPATLSVSPRDGALVVRLVDGGGALVAERAWPGAGPCDAAAEAIAVVAATWLGDLPPVANEVAAPPVPAPSPAVDATPVSVVSATPAPATPAHRWAGTLLVGAGVATPVASPVSTTGTWPVPTVKIAGQLRGTAPTTAFAEIGLVADVPRDRTFGGGASNPGGETDSWDRITIQPMGGVTIRAEDTTLSVGAGLAAGVLEVNGATSSGASWSYHWFDLSAVVEARAGLTLGPAPRDLGLWIALRGREALHSNGASSGGPYARTEVAVLVGGDISFLP
jgi:hypothetical protein